MSLDSLPETVRIAAGGLAPILARLDEADRRRLATLARDLHAYHLPADSIERVWVDVLVLCHWRRIVLDRLEARILAELAEAGGLAGLGALNRLARARARIDEDNRTALRHLEVLSAARPRLARRLTAARLAWLADHAAAREAAVARACARADRPAEDPGARRAAPPATPPVAAAAHAGPEPASAGPAAA